MASEEIKVKRYVCDGCGRVELVNEEFNGPPLGYHLAVMHVHSGGADGGNVWAHNATCIRKAVENYDRDSRDD